MARGQFSHTWAKHEFTAPDIISAATCKRCGTEVRKHTGPGRRRANITITEFKETPESPWTTERVLCKRDETTKPSKRGTSVPSNAVDSSEIPHEP